MTTAKTGKSKSLFVNGRCLHLKIIIVLQLSVSYKSNCVIKRSITFLKNGGILRKSCGIFSATHSIYSNIQKSTTHSEHLIHCIFADIGSENFSLLDETVCKSTVTTCVFFPVIKAWRWNPSRWDFEDVLDQLHYCFLLIGVWLYLKINFIVFFVFRDFELFEASGTWSLSESVYLSEFEVLQSSFSFRLLLLFYVSELSSIERKSMSMCIWKDNALINT